MKKALLSIFVTVLSVAFVNAQDLKLDEILKKHYAAVGQEKLGKVNTIKMTGKQSVQGMELPFTICMKRPGKVRIEADIQGTKFEQAYNGTTGYMKAPIMGITDPKDMDEAQLQDMKDQANIDGKLFDYEKKGNTLELLGTEDVNGVKAYKLKLTEKAEKEGAEAAVTTMFIDCKDFVIIKMVSKKKMGGNTVDIENYTSNFKQVDGLYMPYSIESKVMGNTFSKITFENITLNEDISDDIFEKPVK
jgi:outer membrane lipoprotein-sorting protein